MGQAVLKADRRGRHELKARGPDYTPGDALQD